MHIHFPNSGEEVCVLDTKFDLAIDAPGAKKFCHVFPYHFSYIPGSSTHQVEQRAFLSHVEYSGYSAIKWDCCSLERR